MHSLLRQLCCLFFLLQLNSCSLVTVPVKTAGAIVTTTVETTGNIVTAPFNAAGRGSAKASAPETPPPRRGEAEEVRPANPASPEAGQAIYLPQPQR